MEIKGLQQWYGKFDQIEFDPNILQCESIKYIGCFQVKYVKRTDYCY